VRKSNQFTRAGHPSAFDALPHFKILGHINMKSFLYKIEDVRSPRDGSGQRKRVTVWRVKRNEVMHPPIVCEVYTFMSDFQAVLEHMRPLRPNPLPRRAYERHANTGSWAFTPARLREERLANFTQI
jgi:hypothetical protein